MMPSLTIMLIQPCPCHLTCRNLLNALKSDDYVSELHAYAVITRLALNETLVEYIHGSPMLIARLNLDKHLFTILCFEYGD